jgi:polyisoprenoid-binding protein YceI
MKKILSILLSVLSLTITTNAIAAPQKYNLDKEHTNIMFFINHLGFSETIGRFDDYDGYFIFDKEKPTESMVEVTIKPTSINTQSQALNKELQGEKWFNTEKFPEMHFKSTKIKVTGKNKADVTGWLTMLGVEKPVTLHVTFNKQGEYPMKKMQAAGFSADAEIKRSDFGMNNGIPFVADKVKIHIETEGHLVTEDAAQPTDK